MKLLAVSWSYVLDHAIGDEVEPQILLKIFQVKKRDTKAYSVSVLIMHTNGKNYISIHIQELTMGSWLQYAELRHFVPHTIFPWPSKTPSPDNVNWSICWNVIQPASALNLLVSTGAITVPWTTKLIGALQGPAMIICPSAYVPSGIITVLATGDEQASPQALSKA